MLEWIGIIAVIVCLGIFAVGLGIVVAAAGFAFYMLERITSRELGLAEEIKEATETVSVIYMDAANSARAHEEETRRIYQTLLADAQKTAISHVSDACGQMVEPSFLHSRRADNVSANLFNESTAPRVNDSPYDPSNYDPLA